MIAWVLLLLCVWPIQAQQKISEGQSRPLLSATDWSLLEGDENRDDLGCQIIWANPTLGYGLSYQIRAKMQVSLEKLSHTDSLLVLLRVTASQSGKDTYFRVSNRVPEVENWEQAGKNTKLQIEAGFDAGPGAYKLTWVLRNREGLACTGRQTFRLSSVEGLTLNSQEVQEANEPFSLRSSNGACSDSSSERKAHILLNYSPPVSAEQIDSTDGNALLETIGLISDGCRFNQARLTVMDLERQDILYRSKGTYVDKQELFTALNEHRHGTINANVLAKQRSHFRFLSEVLDPGEDGLQERLIVLSISGSTSSTGGVKDEAPLCSDCVYFRFSRNFAQYPWEDAIDRWMGLRRGTRFEIRTPADLLKAFRQLSQSH